MRLESGAGPGNKTQVLGCGMQASSQPHPTAAPALINAVANVSTWVTISAVFYLYILLQPSVFKLEYFL